MKPNQTAISTQGLTKRYADDVLAVDRLDLSIPANSIYALLGPNGAGKTTTISILTTLIEPTSGHAHIAGLDVVQQADEVRKKIGITFQEIVLDPDLTGRESLDFHARLYGMEKSRRLAKIEMLLDLVELEEAADHRRICSARDGLGPEILQKNDQIGFTIFCLCGVWARSTPKVPG
jgi:ABC-2 type transport system ATP-binding protein